MHEKILTALKTKYKDLGLSDTILKAYADKAEKAVKEEAEIDDVVASYEVDLKVLQSFADQNRTLKKEIEELKKPKPEEPKPEDTPKPEKAGEEVPAWAKELLESNKQLKEELAGYKTEKIQQTNQEKLLGKLKELGVKETFYKGRLKTDFENDEQIEAYAKELKADEDELLRSLNIKSLQDQNPPQFGTETISDNEVSPAVKSLIEQKKNETN